MIFNVDPKKNSRFMQKEDILNERKALKSNMICIDHVLRRLSIEKRVRLRIIQERGVED